MHPSRLRPLVLLALLTLGALALPAHSQSTRSKSPSLVVFKDGFTLHGRIERPTTWFTDPASKQPITVPVAGGYYTVDEGARSIAFSPNQVHDVIPDDPKEGRKSIRLNYHIPRVLGGPLGGKWTLEDVSPFDDRWQRIATIRKDKGSFAYPQRLTVFTPRYFRVDTLAVEWYPYYLTRELRPEQIPPLIYKHIALTKQPEKEIDRQLLVYRFLLQAGWTAEAQRELDKIIKAFPREGERLRELKDGLDKLLAHQFVTALERAHKVGQHEEAQDRLKRFAEEDLSALLTAKTLVKVQELKNWYEAADRKLKEVRRFLQALPPFMPPLERDFCKEALAAILTELNLDTLPRAETFLGQALDWERARKASRPPTQVPEELVAYALSGWLLGDNASEKNYPRAKRLWQARLTILDVQNEPNPVTRKQRITSLDKDKVITPDVVARMIPLLPPPEPHEKPDTDPIPLKGAGGKGGKGGGGVIQLPPEYHHYRPYPVLMVLHHSAEKPADALQRWATLAAENGYILVAPAWGGGKKAEYGYSAREHAVVLDCLRDLRRRFQVDSDRVFLFGCEQGGRMAFDVGLSHPDQFAGVLPMAAVPRYHGFRYWTNAQYLPFYVVNGDNTGQMVKDNRTLFKDWIKRNYPSLNLEYRGRVAEWFEAEPELMIDWMNRKKRASPQKEVGWADEFRTMRETDNRFYWLGTEGIQQRCLNDAGAAWNARTLPAWMQARIFNDNQINVRTSGLLKVTIWLGPGMLNYEQKVKVSLNQSWWGPQQITPSLETMLEEFTRSGDRQRLFWARIDLKAS